MSTYQEKGRKKKKRQINFCPEVCSFIPIGCDKTEDVILLAKDEIEAIRLKNIMGLDIIQAGEKMGVSKSTFARIYEGAIQKLSDAIIHGKKITLEK